MRNQLPYLKILRGLNNFFENRQRLVCGRCPATFSHELLVKLCIISEVVMGYK